MSSTSRHAATAWVVIVAALQGASCGHKASPQRTGDHHIDLTQHLDRLRAVCTGSFSGSINDQSNCSYVGRAFTLAMDLQGEMSCFGSVTGGAPADCTDADLGAIGAVGQLLVTDVPSLAVSGSIGALYPNYYEQGMPDFEWMVEPELQPGLTSQIFRSNVLWVSPPNYEQLQWFYWIRSPDGGACARRTESLRAGARHCRDAGPRRQTAGALVVASPGRHPPSPWASAWQAGVGPYRRRSVGDS